MADLNVVVLGASDKEDKFSNKALKLLKSRNYRIIPVNPQLDFIEGIPVVKKLSDIKEDVHTLTVYVGPGRSEAMIDDIIRLKPERVILNPGTESEKLKNALDNASVRYLEACTIILTNTGQFETA